ncbi:MAG: hypothetical protein M1429_03185 [Patescibacteria group bacterium]|nr:hypothetical protein [Patescibacteria group bacterium]
MNQKEPLRPNTPEIPKVEPEQTPEGLGVPIEETPSKSEETKVAKEVTAEPEMVIEEVGEGLGQEPVSPQEKKESVDYQSSAIEEGDVTNSPIYLEVEASKLTEELNSLQE